MGSSQTLTLLQGCRIRICFASAVLKPAGTTDSIQGVEFVSRTSIVAAVCHVHGHKQ